MLSCSALIQPGFEVDAGVAAASECLELNMLHCGRVYQVGRLELGALTTDQMPHMSESYQHVSARPQKMFGWSNTRGEALRA